MWFSTTKMCSSQCFQVCRPISSLYKCMIARLGLILVVIVGSFSLGYIFLTSVILTVSTVFFTSLSSRTTKMSVQKYGQEEEGCLEEIPESVAEQVAEKGVFQIHEQTQGQEGAGGNVHRALNFLATNSEEESTCNDDDHCITTSEEDDEDGCDNYVARSSLSSADDGSISDEDTLIEIELPTGHYLSPKQHKLKKPSWMELLSEANTELATEEDSLIEIDISIGSIMCPRFEIEA